MFYRPGESSSDDDSSEEDEEVSINDVTQNSAKDSPAEAEEISGIELTTTESLSTNDFSLTNSTGEDGQVTSQDDHRSMMLATMLEELSKYKAAEMLNQAQAGNGILYDKNSPEVQAFAKNLFNQSSGVLNQQGWLPVEATNEQRSGLRQQYLTAFNAIGARQADVDARPELVRGRSNVGNQSSALVRRGGQQPVPFQATAAGQFDQLTWEMDHMHIVGQPSAELQLSPSVRMQSHYQSTFEERGLLGRGGFGRVYHTYNLFDHQEYAIKKIALPPKLSQKYRQKGHQELSQILREVQALAQLDHHNVVRYHATWIEEPTVPSLPLLRPRSAQPLLPYRGQLLLDNKPAQQSTIAKPEPIFGSDDGDPFDRGEDEHSKQLWSVPAPTPSLSHNHETNPFSDGGRSNLHAPHATQLDDPSVYVLHIQMSMYPMTLSEYLLPPNSPRSKSHNLSPRHCFHLIPALRILLSVLCGLQYIHSKGFVHRDIKPSNIFLSTLDFASPVAFAEGYADIGSCPSCLNAVPRFVNPRIGDFGLVADLERAAGRTLGHSSSGSSGGSTKAVGTEYYRPPQHGAGPNDDILDEKLDVFALGVVLLELLWSCGTRMEKVELLQSCQKGKMPERLKEKLREEGHSREVVNMVEACIHGMIATDSKMRWRCAMVKTGVEAILNKLQETAPD